MLLHFPPLFSCSFPQSLPPVVTAAAAIVGSRIGPVHLDTLAADGIHQVVRGDIADGVTAEARWQDEAKSVCISDNSFVQKFIQRKRRGALSSNVAMFPYDACRCVHVIHSQILSRFVAHSFAAVTRIQTHISFGIDSKKILRRHKELPNNFTEKHPIFN